MAELESKIIVSNAEMRPCVVEYITSARNANIVKQTRNAFFHRWIDKCEIVPPSVMKGGHNGGEVRATLALVEFEDGTVGEALPQNIRFLDSPHDQYVFTEREARE